MNFSAPPKQFLPALLLGICALVGCSDNSTNPIDDPDDRLVNVSPDWGPGGLIAYVHYPQTPEELRNGASQIWIGLTSYPGLFITRGEDPSVAPDGTNIAFVRSADIWLVNPMSGEERQLTHTGSCFTPDWSPDGVHIAYKVEVNAPNVPEDSAGIWMIDVRTLQRKQLLRYFGGYPCWSPQGDRIAINAAIGESAPYDELATIDTTSAPLQRLTTHDGSDVGPAWSPNGRAILWTWALEGHWGIWKGNADGSSPKMLIPRGAYPSWSPDGTQVVYVATNAKHQSTLWIANADGSGAHELPY